MSLVLSDLPYAIDALSEHGMSKETMEYHHDIHHKAYVDNGNNLLKGTEWENKSLEEIIVGTYNSNNVAQSGIFNNVSQHWNHEQFWQMMGPAKVSMPSELENAITSSFGSVDKFKEDFCNAGATQFGSGWCWLSIKDGKLVVTKSPNAENPLIHNMKPILGCDVWEHSYYIDYQNKRPAYLENFFDKLINWEFVESNLD